MALDTYSKKETRVVPAVQRYRGGRAGEDIEYARHHSI
jgi:hypothetical protein